MFRLLAIFFLLIGSDSSFGQYKSAYLPEFFFGRIPNARAEAMGKSYVAMNGDLGSVYFNPAGIASAKTVEINTSYTSPGYYSTKGYYTFFGINYKLAPYLQLALSRFQFNYGNTQIANATKTAYVEKNTLTLASEPIKNVLVGLNANYFIWQPGIDKTSKALYLDLGVVKTIPIVSHIKTKQKINIGGSLSNLNYAKTTATFNNITEEYRLPVTARFGVSYLVDFRKVQLSESSSIINFLGQIEYQTLLNSPFRSALKVGAEATLLDILSLRGGWYSEKVDNFGFPDDNKSSLKSFTYGIGLHTPKLSTLPIEIHIDFTSLPQVSYSKNTNDWSKFTTYGLRLVYSRIEKKR